MIASAALLFAAAAAAPDSPSVRRVPFAGGERIEVDAGGAIVDVAVVAAADGSRSALLLVGGTREGRDDQACGVRDADAPPASAKPRSLLRIPTLANPSPVLVWGGLDPTTSHLRAFDLDGDGADDLILGRRGALEVLRNDEIVTLLSTPGVEPAPGFGRPRGPWVPSRFHVIDVGSLASFGAPDEGAGWALRGSATLPKEVLAGSRSIRLRTLPFVPVGPSRRGGDVLASDPESVGEERLRVWRVEPEGTEREAVECWARLPERERRIDADFVRLDGEPALMVTTMRADKLEIFGEKRLRIFRLEPDRTKTGIAPFLSAETGANLWQAVQASAADVDGDARDDLVLAYWKGLKNEKVAFEIWSRDEADDWPSQPSSGTLEVPDGDTSFLDFGDDVNGDGMPDLLVAGGGALRVHLGIPVPRRGLPVDRDPAAVLPLPDGVERLGTAWIGMGPQGIEGGSAIPRSVAPRAEDLDGDGVAEILLRDTKHPERLTVYRWAPREDR